MFRPRQPLEHLIDEDITDRPGRIMLKLAGGVLSLAGVGLLALSFALLYFAWLDDRTIDRPWIIIFSICVIVGSLCTIVGFRMFLNRPNAYGSVLSPVGWILLGTLFACGAILCLLLGFSAEAFLLDTLIATLSGALFAVCCFYMAERLRHRNRVD